MPRIGQVIRHIREHVVSESADTDPTQTSGMLARTQLVLDAIQLLRNDTRNLTLREVLQEIYNLIPNRQGRVSFRRAITNMRDSGERTPWIAIHEWVARGRESLDDGYQRN